VLGLTIMVAHGLRVDLTVAPFGVSGKPDLGLSYPASDLLKPPVDWSLTAA